MTSLERSQVSNNIWSDDIVYWKILETEESPAKDGKILVKINQTKYKRLDPPWYAPWRKMQPELFETKEIHVIGRGVVWYLFPSFDSLCFGSHYYASDLLNKIYKQWDFDKKVKKARDKKVKKARDNADGPN